MRACVCPAIYNIIDLAEQLIAPAIRGSPSVLSRRYRLWRHWTRLNGLQIGALCHVVAGQPL
jgi:hypothetical protein